jgi:hypothetical protein
VPVSCHRNPQHLSHKKSGIREQIAVFVPIKIDLPIWHQRRHSLNLSSPNLRPDQSNSTVGKIRIAAGLTLCSLELTCSSVTGELAVKQNFFERTVRQNFAIDQ